MTTVARDLRHLLFLRESPFDKRDFDRHGVDVLVKTFQVSILDCTRWLKPDFFDKYAATAHSWEGYRQIASFDVLREQLEGRAGAVAIDTLGDSAQATRVRRELKQRNIERAVLNITLLPKLPQRRIRRLLSAEGPAILGRRLRKIGRTARDPEPPAEIAIMSGVASLEDARVGTSTRCIWAHSLDYNLFLRHRGESSRTEPYAVFLDEDVGYHPDYEHAGIAPPMNADKYYASMNAVFDEVEREAGFPVIVAAHPHSRYELRPGVWRARQVMKGETPQLVRDASVVLAHSSTAISFAVLWRKPLIVLTTPQLDRSFQGPAIRMRSDLLKAPLLNIGADAPTAVSAALSRPLDAATYASYSAEYIKKPGTPDLDLWQIFADAVGQQN